MSLIKLIIEVPETAQTVADNIRAISGGASESVQRVGGYIQGISAKSGNVKLSTGAVKAACAFTFTGAPTAAETLTINGVTFTIRASGATGNEFNIGGTVTATAANMAAAVNASVTAGISGVVTAASALGVCTVSAVTPGKAGNYLLAPTESMTNTAVAGWAGGAEDATITMSVGV